MKKLISIDDLAVGMFVEADVDTEVREGAEQHFLKARHAVALGTSSKRARLTGRMGEKVRTQGGLLITSAAQLSSLRETGLSTVSIDTARGDDLPERTKPLTDPHRRPPPPGRLVHFDEEIERAREVRQETSQTLKEALGDVASGKGIDLEKVQNASSVITESIMRNLDAMVSLTRIKKHDPYTAMHCMNVCTLVVAMAQVDGLEPTTIQIITTAALLHDIGKTRVPLEILNKPGRFEPHELAQMRKHAVYSGEIMREAGGFSEEQIAIATQHHETMDGRGYPQGLKGDQIHPYARMTTVADVYDALTAKRVYKAAMPMHQALLRILKNKGIEFEEHAVELFVKTLGLYPVGSLVELSSRERAMVYEPNPENPRKPTVALLTTPNQKPRAAPYIVHLGRRSEAEDREIVKALDPEQLNIDVEHTMREIEERGEHTERMRR